MVVCPNTPLGGTRTAQVRSSSRNRDPLAVRGAEGPRGRRVGRVALLLGQVHALLSHGQTQLPNIAATTHGPCLVPSQSATWIRRLGQWDTQRGPLGMDVDSPVNWPGSFRVIHYKVH